MILEAQFTESITALQKKDILFCQLIWKNRKPKSRLDQKLCQFLFSSCDIYFDKLSRLGQISCAISYYIEKDSLYLGKFFVSLLENWCKMKDYSIKIKFQSFYEIFGGRCKSGASLWRHFPKFFKAVSKQCIATKQQYKILNLYFLRWKNWSSVIFPKFWNFSMLVT